MEVCCDLEVDVNGEETFMVDKKIISLYSGKLRRMFGKSLAATRNLKVIFQDFPGGPESFELMSRFCYGHGLIEMSPQNISLLHGAAHFMEMNGSVSGTDNLVEQTLKSLKEVKYWTWPDLLFALKQCQELLPAANVFAVLDKCLDSLIGRLALAIEPSPSPSISSSDSSAYRLSCDTKSTESLRNGFSRATWWFEDLLFLNPSLLERAVRSMVLQKVDHATISKFLFYYQKSKFSTATPQGKCNIVETVIDSLYCLDHNLVPGKSLFGIMRVSLGLNISKFCRNKLETMIGSQLDQATLDNLLLPSPPGMSNLYDVDLVLRLLKAFLQGRTCSLTKQLKRVSSLMDLYIAEVAPDPCLKPSKFLNLVTALPNSARDSYDEVYRAMDMYIEVHAGLSEDEKMNLCCALDYEKLSPEACRHHSQNTKFPSKTAIQAVISKQCKLKSLLRAANEPKLSTAESQCLLREGKNKGKTAEESEQIVLYAGELDLPADNEWLRAHLQGMQWRVMELEKVCRKMQIQMAKIMKSKSPVSRNARSVPRFCS